MDMVGGDKAYKSMLDWAGDNFSKEEVEMYDGVMESGNPNAISLPSKLSKLATTMQ